MSMEKGNPRCLFGNYVPDLYRLENELREIDNAMYMLTVSRPIAFRVDLLGGDAAVFGGRPTKVMGEIEQIADPELNERLDQCQSVRAYILEQINRLK